MIASKNWKSYHRGIKNQHYEQEEIKVKEALLIDLTRNFCIQNLNEEYAELCVGLIKKMGRKREVPFKRGKPEIWAAAVIHTIGSLNFLFDSSFEPILPVKIFMTTSAPNPVP